MFREYNFKKNVISKDATVFEAMRKLEDVNIKILYVVEGDDELLASITDGDIRRAVLSGLGMEAKTTVFAKKEPRKVLFDQDAEAQRMMVEKKLLSVPAVDNNNRIKYIYINSENNNSCVSETVNIPVVIMAGGEGKRLYPYTKILPKPLIPVGGTPICERIINQFVANGCSKFHMVVNYKKNMIKSYFSESSLSKKIAYYDETIPLGTGGGIKLLEGKVEETFVLTNCDILVLEEVASMLKHHRDSGNVATMICSLKNYTVPYGVVHFSAGGEMDYMEEKPRMSFFVNTGYYVLEPTVFEYVNDDESISMPEILERLKRAGHKVGVYPLGENSWLDMGQFDSMEGMETRLNELGL